MFVDLRLYLPVSRIMKKHFKYHYELRDFNVLDVSLLQLLCPYWCSNFVPYLVSGNLLKLALESFWKYHSVVLGSFFADMTTCLKLILYIYAPNSQLVFKTRVSELVMLCRFLLDWSLIIDLFSRKLGNMFLSICLFLR